MDKLFTVIPPEIFTSPTKHISGQNALKGQTARKILLKHMSKSPKTLMNLLLSAFRLSKSLIFYPTTAKNFGWISHLLTFHPKYHFLQKKLFGLKQPSTAIRPKLSSNPFLTEGTLCLLLFQKIIIISFYTPVLLIATWACKLTCVRSMISPEQL